jgi:hypothetical protein
MAKKLSLAMAAIAAIAVFAIPATASAAPTVTMPAGTLVPVGTELTGTSTDAEITTSLGAIHCGTVHVNAELTKNNGTEVEAVGVGQGLATTCAFTAGEAITVTDVTLFKLSATAAAKKLEFTLIADLGPVTCHFVTPAGGINFTYVSGSDTITIAEQKLTATPAACRPGEFQASFTIETTAGGAVILD